MKEGILKNDPKKIGHYLWMIPNAHAQIQNEWKEDFLPAQLVFFCVVCTYVTQQ